MACSFTSLGMFAKTNRIQFDACATVIFLSHMVNKAEQFGNIHPLKNGREVGDRVFIRRDKLEKYVRGVEVPEDQINAWRKDRETAVGYGDEDAFLRHDPHPKAEVVSDRGLFIVQKIPGKYKLAPLMHSKKSVWVDVDDVEDNPVYGHQALRRPERS